MHREAARYVTTTTAAAAGAMASVATSAILAASVILAPVPDAATRMQGISEDLRRAVELHQMTEEQAVRFEARLAGMIVGDAGGGTTAA